MNDPGRDTRSIEEILAAVELLARQINYASADEAPFNVVVPDWIHNDDAVLLAPQPGTDHLTCY